MKAPLTICIPTNRTFELLEPTLLSALNFCETTKSQLILSNNSLDKNKENKLNQFKSSNVKVFKGPTIGVDNWYNAVKRSESLYTLILCDDDIIFNLTKSKVNYEQARKHNVIGIKPTISLWNKNVGIYKENNFHLDSEDPLERVLNYAKNCSGNNTSMYSFYDTNILKDLLSVFLYHPNRGGYTDWAFMLALASSGKIIHSPKDLLIYRNNNWFDIKSNLIKKERDLYLKAGIGNRGILYSYLFKAIDAFILIFRRNSPISRKILLETAKVVLKRNLNLFLKNFEKNKIYYKNEEIIAISKINIEKDLFTIFYDLLEVIITFKKDLGDQYKHFYLNAIGEKWGIVN